MSLPGFMSATLMRRLLPLYIAAFSHGFVLWYAVEKYFMHTIGFTDATIGVMVAAYTAVMLFAETPSGILADRWSRKGVLMIASSMLVASTLLGGWSYSVPVYMVAMGLWGVFYALYSGTYESVVYDILLEEKGNAKAFEKWYGYVRSIDSVALALGAVIGGLIAMWYSPRATFFITVPFCCIAVVALWKFKEPQLHKIDPISSLRQHVGETFAAVLRKKALLPLVLVLVSTALLVKSMLEFNQLWWLALTAPIGLYGLATALNLSAPGIAGVLASRIRLDKRTHCMAFAGILVLAATTLVSVRHFFVIVAAQVVLVATLVVGEVIFTRSLHDTLPSRLRAGSASAVSTVGGIIFIPFSLAFGLLSDGHSIFVAAWLILVCTIFLVLILLATVSRRRLLSVRPQDILEVEQYQK